MRHSVLEDPIIRLSTAGGVMGASLPEVLAALVVDGVEAFPELAPWQGHAWHSFLVQLAGLALVRGGVAEPPADAEAWAGLLRGAARADGWEGGDEPWCLVVEDWTKPAFLQAPLPAATHKDLKPAAERPDLLDVLVTAKNHDVKAGRADRATPGQWLFALLSLQTMQGYSGKSWFGITRMNGGFSSRPALGLVPGPRPGARFLRDLRVLLAARDGFLSTGPRGAEESPWGYRADGLGLLWLVPWDGATALTLGDLDPWFIEICRRVRLAAGEDDGLCALAAGSQAARIDAKALTGNVGDPWVPVDLSGKALTVGGRGFHYGDLCDILKSGEFKLSLMQRAHAGIDEDQVALLARVLVRGQGQTEGYHERLVPLPGALSDDLFSDDGRRVLGEVAEERIADVKTLSGKVLYPGLRRLLRPRDDDEGRLPPGENAWVNKALDDLDRRVDAAFFDHLWPEVRILLADTVDGAAREAARVAWLRFLTGEGREVMAAAIRSAPKVLSRTYRSRAEAEGLFLTLLRRNFAAVFPPEDSERKTAHG